MEKDIQKRFQNIRIGMSGDKRAPHKPLLLLWAIARCMRREQRLVPYKVVDEELRDLLCTFGPHVKRHNTHYPFWRLQNDRIWEIDRPELVGRTKSDDPLKPDLEQHRICGGLTSSDYEYFQKNPFHAQELIESLIAQHFPPSLFDEVLESVSFPLSCSHVEEADSPVKWSMTKRRVRDPSFRSRVLAAYDGQCSICGFSIRFPDLDQPLAIEAAHVQWHEYNGPSVVENGLALCALHHRLLDKGAFTVLPDLRVFVSPSISGNGLDYTLGQFNRKRLRIPQNTEFPRPSEEFLTWHGSQVFRNPELLDSILV